MLDELKKDHEALTRVSIMMQQSTFTGEASPFVAKMLDFLGICLAYKTKEIEELENEKVSK